MASTCFTKVIAKREWCSYFNSPVAYVFIVIFLALSGFFTFQVSRFFDSGQADLQSFFMWHPWLYLILVPAVTMRAWAEERRSGTMELLLTLPIHPMQAIVGKFLAAWFFMGLALVLTLPVVFTVNYLGKPDNGAILCGYLGSFFMAGAYVAVGMFTSSLTRNQVISFILAVVIGLLLILAGFPPVSGSIGTMQTRPLVIGLSSFVAVVIGVTVLAARLSGGMTKGFLVLKMAGGVAALVAIVTAAFVSDATLQGLISPQQIASVIAGFSFMDHYEWMQRGVVHLKDLVYFGSIIGFMLLATQVVLDNRKGK